MFTIHKTDTGAVMPWEYMPAAAGEYKVGQMLNVSGGKLNTLAENYAKVPGYLCMADITAAAGDLIPVTRVTDDAIYKTEFGAGTSAGVAAGHSVEVAAGGMAVTGSPSTGGAFLVIAMEDDAAAEGGVVYGRFV